MIKHGFSISYDRWIYRLKEMTRQTLFLCLRLKQPLLQKKDLTQ